MDEITQSSFTRKLGAVVIAALFCNGASHAQSVADAARESRATRQPGANIRIFTNEDAPDSTPSAPAPSSITATVRTAAARHEITYEPYEGSTQRVIINVTLNGRVQARLAVDTGAPQTIIFSRLAERLGLLNETSVGVWTNAGGIGGNAPAICTIIDTIRVADVEQSFFPAKIVDDLSGAFDGLVGMDFLSLFVVRIDPTRHLMILEDAAPSSVLYGQRDEHWWRANYKEFADLRHGWHDYAGQLSKTIESSNITAGAGIDDARQKLDFARKQALDSERLFDQLNRRAIQYLVPMNWREY